MSARPASDTPIDTRRQVATHIVIPDTQVAPGTPTDHLTWIGKYIVEHFKDRPDVTLIHLGDHADMPSLSSYDRGKKQMEGRRYVADVGAANAGFSKLNAPLLALNARRSLTKHKQWWPRRVITLGNHEDRITRAVEADAQLEGLLSLDQLNYADLGWEVVPYLQPIDIDGVTYCHYFYAPLTGRALGGTAANMLQKLGHSFTQGHRQTLDYSIRFVRDKSQHGLIAGACYTHEEDYKGPQGNSHWRGIIVKHAVQDGSYNVMMVDLAYLERRFGKKR